jgi:hypothetical protein
MIYNYEYTLDSLREKIALEINKTGTSLELEAIGTPATSITLTIATFVNEAKQITSYLARTRTEEFDNIALTDDELTAISGYHTEAVETIKIRFNAIIASSSVSGTAYTLTLKNSLAISTPILAILKVKFEKYVANFIAYKWLLTNNHKSANEYLKLCEDTLGEVIRYNERKNDIISIELKRAAFRVYDNFMFSGKSLLRPVLFDEEYIYPIQTDISDGVNTFDIDAVTVDSSDKIYYWFNMHGNWEESLDYPLDNLLEEAIVTFVVKEYFRKRPEFINDYSIAQQRYSDLISDIRVNLFTRLKNKATRSETSWL